MFILNEIKPSSLCSTTKSWGRIKRQHQHKSHVCTVKRQESAYRIKYIYLYVVLIDSTHLSISYFHNLHCYIFTEPLNSMWSQNCPFSRNILVWWVLALLYSGLHVGSVCAQKAEQMQVSLHLFFACIGYREFPPHHWL